MAVSIQRTADVKVDRGFVQCYISSAFSAMSRSVAIPVFLPKLIPHWLSLGSLGL